MKVKRVRIFAGPNGSGKSTFIKRIIVNPPSPSVKLGYYVNADDIEREIKKNGYLHLKKFGCSISSKELQSYFRKSQFAPLKLNFPDLWKLVNVEGEKLYFSGKVKINSYIAADIAEFLRQKLLLNNFSFSYETVMSDKKKISFLKNAKKQGYRIYLYFFATEDPLININRVKVRVARNGHNVNEEVIKKRYYRSLENLLAAVKISDRAFLFDNSGVASVLVSEIANGKSVTIFNPDEVPNWVIKYLSNK